jgi:hypothetical protein
MLGLWPITFYTLNQQKCVTATTEHRVDAIRKLSNGTQPPKTLGDIFITGYQRTVNIIIIF